MSQMNFSQTVQQKIETIKTLFLNFLETFETEENGRLIKHYREQAIQMKLQERNTLYVDFVHLLNFNSDNNDIHETILSDYYRIEPHLRKVVSNFVFTVNNTAAENENYFLSLYNLPVQKRIRDLRTSEIGKLNSIKGLITRSTEVRPELLYGSFICELCNSEVRDVDQQFKYTFPKVCSNPGCNNHGKWTLKTNSSTFTDFQKLRVQEESTDIPPGGMPRCIDVVVRGEIVDKAKPGDKCIFSGYLVVVPDITALTKPGEQTEMGIKNDAVRVRNEGTNDGITGLSQLGQRDLSYKLVFIATNVESYKHRFNMWSNDEENEELTEEEANQLRTNQLSENELEQIQRMKNSDNIYDRLAASLVPTVHGHLEIKKGILLMLLGGVNKKTEEGINLRGDINICMVGDPSTAKSQFLKYVNKLIPRSVYTSGKASTSAGLTASVTKDPETGENCIEAGALMLSDQGICCIDEFDKMDKKDQVAIHEAMEQQTISISKAGIQATLNSRASILAAANPVFGRYDKSKSLKYNVDISAPILSRFDLFFVILDECNEQSDKMIAQHIVNIHQFSGKNIDPEFTTEDIQKYIRFGRSIKPVFTHEAAVELQKSYVKLRSNDASTHNSSYRITVRQLESLIRLSEALARAHITKEVTAEYVKEASRLLSTSIIKLEKGQIDYIDDEEQKPDLNENKDQNIIQEEIERRQQEERKKQNKIKLTYEEFQNMRKIIIQTVNDLEIEEQVKTQTTEEDGMEVEKQYGFTQNEIIDRILRQMLEADLLNTQEDAIKLKRVYGQIIKRLIEVDHILVVVEDSNIPDDRRVTLHNNYVEN